MFELITNNFMGATITIGITGLPITITGQVVNSGEPNVVALRVDGGNKVYISGKLIAFFF